MSAETWWNDECHGSITGPDGGFRSCGGVFRLLNSSFRCWPGFDRQRFLAQSFYELLRCPAVVFVDDDDSNFRRGISASAEDDGKDREERDRQDEAEGKCASVAAQRREGGMNDG